MFPAAHLGQWRKQFENAPEKHISTNAAKVNLNQSHLFVNRADVALV
jgi:hypothetical protein